MPAINLQKASQYQIPNHLRGIICEIIKEGGTVFIVGGFVRDLLLDIPSKDVDFEIYGIDQKTLTGILYHYGRPNLVGKAFGVATMTIHDIRYDFAFPRIESKIGKGHKGFMTKPNPDLTFKEASGRRDFTINALGLKLPEMEIEDCHGGLADLSLGLLRHISPAFSEDPLRALRAVQFAARFGFDIHPDTQTLCALQPLDELPAERIFEELKKLLLKAQKPSIGLEWLHRMKLLSYFPELEALVGVPQDPEWHPEGDVWEHNNLVVDAAAHIRDTEIDNTVEDEEFEKITLMLGALCHDFGKALTTKKISGRWRSPSHDAVGETPTRSFLSRLTRDQKLTEQVVVYVREHLKPALLYKARHDIKPSAIRRLSLKIDIKKLVRMAKADHFGRTTPDALERSFEAGDWLLSQSEQLKVLDQKPKPLLTGKILISLGMEPGPLMGEIIGECFELQLEGDIVTVEEAMEWGQKRVKML